MGKKTVQPPQASAQKSINSYNRRLNAGIIKKDVFDNRMQKLSCTPPTVANSTNKPSPRNSNIIQNKPPTTVSSTSSSRNLNSSFINNKPVSAPMPQQQVPKNSLSSHILSRGPISNLSGQYPMNGAPGGSLR